MSTTKIVVNRQQPLEIEGDDLKELLREMRKNAREIIDLRSQRKHLNRFRNACLDGASTRVEIFGIREYAKIENEPTHDVIELSEFTIESIRYMFEDQASAIDVVCTFDI